VTENCAGFPCSLCPTDELPRLIAALSLCDCVCAPMAGQCTSPRRSASRSCVFSAIRHRSGGGPGKRRTSFSAACEPAILADLEVEEALAGFERLWRARLLTPFLSFAHTALCGGLYPGP